MTDKRTDSSLFMADFLVPELRPFWITELQALFTAPITGEYEFSMCVTGMGRLWVDGELVVDASNELEKGSAFFGCGSNEIKGRVKVEKGKVGLRALYWTRLTISNIKSALCTMVDSLPERSPSTLRWWSTLCEWELSR